MRWFSLRPTFEIPLSEPREVAIARLLQECQRRNQPRLFFVHGEYGELHLPSDEHRLWSPHLTFYVAQHGTRTLIHGRFAPRLEIWTLVWVLYLAMVFTAFFSLVMAYSQWALGEATWWHWVGLAAIGCVLAIYLVAHTGQQWSADQMHKLRGQLERLLQESSLTANPPAPPGRD